MVNGNRAYFHRILKDRTDKKAKTYRNIVLIINYMYIDTISFINKKH